MIQDVARFLARQSKFRDLDTRGVGSECARAVAAALLVGKRQVEPVGSPLNMKYGHGDLLGTDYDVCVSQPCESYALRDAADRQRTYREHIEDVVERGGDDNNSAPEIIEVDGMGGNAVKRGTYLPSAGGADAA